MYFVLSMVAFISFIGFVFAMMSSAEEYFAKNNIKKAKDYAKIGLAALVWPISLVIYVIYIMAKRID